MIIKMATDDFRDWYSSGGVSVMRDIPKRRFSGRMRLVRRLADAKVRRPRGGGKLLQLKQVAEMIGVCVKTLRRWRKLGLVPKKFTMQVVKQILELK